MFLLTANTDARLVGCFSQDEIADQVADYNEARVEGGIRMPTPPGQPEDDEAPEPEFVPLEPLLRYLGLAPTLKP